MTRINAGIPPKALTDEHLLAEHREIKRIPGHLKKILDAGDVPEIPKSFCLGTGHVRFFLDKMGYLSERYKEIHDECLNRGFKVTDYSDNFRDIRAEFFGLYVPSDKDRNIVEFRIRNRIANSKKKCWHYYGKAIRPEFKINREILFSTNR